MPLAEAAKERGVGRTTFKRVLRSHGIERWRPQSIYNRAVKKGHTNVVVFTHVYNGNEFKSANVGCTEREHGFAWGTTGQDQKKQLESKVSNGTFAKNSTGVEEKIRLQAPPRIAKTLGI